MRATSLIMQDISNSDIKNMNSETSNSLCVLPLQRCCALCHWLHLLDAPQCDSARACAQGLVFEVSPSSWPTYGL